MGAEQSGAEQSVRLLVPTRLELVVSQGGGLRFRSKNMGKNEGGKGKARSLKGKGTSIRTADGVFEMTTAHQSGKKNARVCGEREIITQKRGGVARKDWIRE